MNSYSAGPTYITFDILIRMSRKYRKSSGDKMFEDLIKMSSVFPWWISVGVAILLFVFVPLGIHQPGASFSHDQVSGMLVGMIFGIVFKYFLPFTLILGGLTNLFKRGKSAWIFNSINSNGARETLQQLSWKDFEFLISEYFKKQNFRVDLIDAQGADGGIDIKLFKEDALYLVQCKHYKAWKVPVQVVRELYGIMTAEKAMGGYIVTTGKFTTDAISFASNTQIELIDGSKLEKILDGELSNFVSNNTTTSSDNSGTCPRCGHKLVVRKSARGEFLGCSSFPKCRYTSDLK